MDPSFEDMKKAVVIDKRRPVLPNQWSQSEVSSYSIIAVISFFVVLPWVCIVASVGVIFL